MTPFWICLGLYSPIYCSILLKWSEVVPNKTNTVFQKSLKILDFGSNVTHLNFIFLVHSGTQFTARKPKMFLKTRISAKTTYRPTSLGISNNVSIRSQKNHIILVKLSKRKFGDGGKLGLNCRLVPLLKVIINSHLAYHTTIHYLLFTALPKINNYVLFFQDPIGPIWSGLWAIPLVKNARLSWYFDDR